MKNLMKPNEVIKKFPNFFNDRPADVNWTLSVVEPNGAKHSFIGCDWEAVSKFGKVENVVVMNDKGDPLFDRPRYFESRNINMIIWGRDRDGEIKIAWLEEKRPHAANPQNSKNYESLIFGQVPMGFLNKLLGDEFLDYENFLQGTIREANEEAGITDTAILNITRPEFPYHNPNPTFVGTWSDLYFVEIDLAKIKKNKPDHDELIYNVEYISTKELLYRIRKGKNEKGVLSRACTSLSLLMIFFATYPEFFPK